MSDETFRDCTFGHSEQGAVQPDGSVPQEIVEKVARALNFEAGRQRGLALSDDWEDLTNQERGGWRLCATEALEALLFDDIQALLQAKTDMDVLYLDSWRVIAFRERPRTDG